MVWGSSTSSSYLVFCPSIVKLAGREHRFCALVKDPMPRMPESFGMANNKYKQ